MNTPVFRFTWPDGRTYDVRGETDIKKVLYEHKHALYGFATYKFFDDGCIFKDIRPLLNNEAFNARNKR